MLGAQSKRDWRQCLVNVGCFRLHDGLLRRILTDKVSFDVLTFADACCLKPLRLKSLWILEKVSLHNLLSPSQTRVVQISVGLAYGDILARTKVTKNFRDTQIGLAVKQVSYSLSPHDLLFLKLLLLSLHHRRNLL